MRTSLFMFSVLILLAGSVVADDSLLSQDLQLATEAEALCEAESVHPTEDCVRIALGDEGIKAASEARDAQRRADFEAFYSEVAEQLLLRGEPRAMLLASRLLRWTIDFRVGGPRQDQAAQAQRGRIGQAVREAAMRGGDDPLLLWTLATGGFHRELPDLTDVAVARLRAREPDNLAVHVLGGPTGAWSSQRVTAAAATRRFDLPYLDVLRSDLALLVPFVHPPELLENGDETLDSIDSHLVLMMGMQMAESVPAMHGLTLACLPGRGAWLPKHRSPCERIAEVLAKHSNTSIGWGIGLALLEGLADTDEKRAAAEQARRAYRYTSEGAMKQQWSRQGQRDWMRRMRESTLSEVEQMRQSLLQQRLPLESPPDWQPIPTDEYPERIAAARERPAE